MKYIKVFAYIKNIFSAARWVNKKIFRKNYFLLAEPLLLQAPTRFGMGIRMHFTYITPMNLILVHNGGSKEMRFYANVIIKPI